MAIGTGGPGQRIPSLFSLSLFRRASPTFPKGVRLSRRLRAGSEGPHYKVILSTDRTVWPLHLLCMLQGGISGTPSRSRLPFVK